MQAMDIAVPSRSQARRLTITGDWALLGSGWTTLLMVIAGAGLGGYLGGVSVLYAWTFARQVVLDKTQTTRRRIGTGLLGLTSAAVLYSTGLSLFRLLLPS